MNKAIEVMTWVMRLEATPTASPHAILGVAATASADDIQLAFYNAAKKAHPDRFRAVLSAPQMDRLTRAYSRVTEAYGIMTGRIRRSAVVPVPANASTGTPRPGPASGSATPATPARRPATPTTPAELEAQLAQQMSNKALPYFRRAEVAFANDDAKVAGLQLRLAIAADPTSAYLRRVLHELESATKK